MRRDRRFIDMFWGVLVAVLISVLVITGLKSCQDNVQDVLGYRATVAQYRADLALRGMEYNEAEGLHKEIIGGHIFELQRSCFAHVDRYNELAAQVPDHKLKEWDMQRYISPQLCRLTALED